MKSGEIIISVAAGLFLVGLLATGGLITSGKEMPTFITKLHQFLPYLILFATAVFIYQQMRKK